MSADQRVSGRVFHALDGMRGVAALFVAMRHTFFFHRLGIPGGYMAVDLFFVLSGFVIAHAYDRRLETGLSPARFVVLRYLRLWPVYALGAVLGLIAAAMHALPPHDDLTAAQVARTAPFALAMLPGPHIRPMLYPVNSVAWSLALELIVNLAYAVLWRPLRQPWVLAATMAASAIGLVAAVLAFGKLDIGFQWVDAVGGLPRVVFSFTAGLALYRLYLSGRWRLKAPAWLWVLLLAPLFCVSLGAVVYPLACAFVLFPALVFLAATAPDPGPWLTRLFAVAGAASYPLYALHKPLGEIVVLLTHRVAPWVFRSWPVEAGFVYLAPLLALCLLVERHFDRPVRRVLSREVPRLAEAIWDRVTGGAAALAASLKAPLGNK